jgi:pilus assembly protein TadC
VAAPRLGSAIAIALMVLTSTLARDRRGARESLLLAALSAGVFSWLFVGLLGVQLKIFP